MTEFLRNLFWPPGLVLLGAVLAVVLWETRKALLIERRKKRAAIRRFRDQASLWRASASQLRLLEALMPYVSVSGAEGLFASPQLFETALDRFLAAHRPSAAVYDDVRALREMLGFAQLGDDAPLCSTRQLSAGTRVSFSVAGNPSSFAAIVEEADDRSWSLRRPNGVPLKAGEMIVVRVRRADGDYRIPARIRDLSSTLVRMEHTLEVEQSQQRNWVRVPLCEEVTVRPLGRDGEETKPILGYLSDMSGGGCSFKTVRPLESGQEVELTFALRSHRFERVRARVLRVSGQIGAGEGLFSQSVEFSDLATSERERLVRYVFDRGRKVSG